jgi:phosphoglycerate dehydrogenase-like enzyme
MRIHIQNPSANDLFAVTPAQWEQAAARAGEPGHQVSFGSDAQDFANSINEAEVLVAQPGTVRRLLPFTAPHLRLLFCTAAGLDALMPFDWLPPGLMLVNNRGVHGGKMADYATMALLMLNARVPAFAHAQARQQWTPQYVQPIAGRHATVVGTGDVGSAVGRAARTLGLRASGVRTRAKPHPDFHRVVSIDELDRVLPESDFLVLACPLLPNTRNLLNRRRLALLPRGAAVVNVGRGALLDQQALAERLAAGELSGAILDVVEPEPLPPGHALWSTPNLVITPHVSTDDPVGYNPASLAIFFANLQAWREGRQMPNQVDPQRGY